MSILQIKDLTKIYGETVAVDGVNFEVEEGEFVSILGPSGSGKSTILRLIAGFENPTEGTVRIVGENVIGTPPFDRDINMVFQNLALFPHLTVAENIEYGLRQHGVPKTERRNRVEEILEMIKLSGYGERDVNELSGGEQQRVALARAIVNQPQLVLFDEPLASLDRKLRQHMRYELKRIQNESGRTFLYVTHDQETALSVSDRLIVLNEGRIEQIGSAEELYEQPNTRFVANFIGDINTIPSVPVDRSDKTVSLRINDKQVPFNDVRGADKIGETELVDVCLRPKDISIVNHGDADGNVFTTGIVKNRSYQGDTIAYLIETEWGDFHVTDNQREYRIEEGESVDLGWSLSNAHIFPATGER